MAKPVIKYVDFYNGYCRLTTDAESTILREEGTRNVKQIRPATKADVEHMRAMGGPVPDGRIAKAVFCKRSPGCIREPGHGGRCVP
jgi:hypothetical protein